MIRSESVGRCVMCEKEITVFYYQIKLLIIWSLNARVEIGCCCCQKDFAFEHSKLARLVYFSFMHTTRGLTISRGWHR